MDYWQYRLHFNTSTRFDISKRSDVEQLGNQVDTGLGDSLNRFGVGNHHLGGYLIKQCMPDYPVCRFLTRSCKFQ